MAFSANDLIRIQLIQTGYGEVQHVWDYQIVNIPAPTITAANIGEAWWNHVKTVYRAQMSGSFGVVFRRVRVTSLMSATGDAGEFGIPAAESQGTRTPPAGDLAPAFLAEGVRLNVETRLTRPGQKRFWGFHEADLVNDTIQAAFNTLVEAIPNSMLPGIVLGAPAATVGLDPMVVGDVGTYPPVRYQPWTSISANIIVTTQNSRKRGRGS